MGTSADSGGGLRDIGDRLAWRYVILTLVPLVIGACADHFAFSLDLWSGKTAVSRAKPDDQPTEPPTPRPPLPAPSVIDSVPLEPPHPAVPDPAVPSTPPSPPVAETDPPAPNPADTTAMILPRPEAGAPSRRECVEMYRYARAEVREYSSARISSHATSHPTLVNAESSFSRIDDLCPGDLDAPRNFLFIRAFHALYRGDFEAADSYLQKLFAAPLDDSIFDDNRPLEIEMQLIAGILEQCRGDDKSLEAFRLVRLYLSRRKFDEANAQINRVLDMPSCKKLRFYVLSKKKISRLPAAFDDVADHGPGLAQVATGADRRVRPAAALPLPIMQRANHA